MILQYMIHKLEHVSQVVNHVRRILLKLLGKTIKLSSSSVLNFFGSLQLMLNPLRKRGEVLVRQIRELHQLLLMDQQH